MGKIFKEERHVIHGNEENGGSDSIDFKEIESKERF